VGIKILIFIFLSSLQPVMAQNQALQFRITPDLPTSDDVVSLEIFYSDACNNFQLSSLDITGFVVDVVVGGGCFIGVTPPTVGVWHSFELGQFSPGQYQLNLNFENTLFDESFFAVGTPVQSVNALSRIALLVLIVSFLLLVFKRRKISFCTWIELI